MLKFLTKVGQKTIGVHFTPYIYYLRPSLGCGSATLKQVWKFLTPCTNVVLAGLSAVSA